MYQEIFLFAAKVGALEGYLFRRRKTEPLANWVGSISQMYHELSPVTKKEVSPAFTTVLGRILKYGGKVLEPELKEKLQQLANAASTEAGAQKTG